MIVVDAADMKVTRKYTFVERDLTFLLPLGYVPAPAFADGRKPAGVSTMRTWARRSCAKALNRSFVRAVGCGGYMISRRQFLSASSPLP